jgi:hypothetical protein
MKTQNKVYLTFDIEIIVARFSKNDNCYASICLAPLIIANFLKKRNLKGTFFISLSPKTKGIPYSVYMNYLEILLQGLRGFENIKLAPHLHAYELPVNFSCKKDHFYNYTLEQQITLLNWSRELFKKFGYEVDSFRPGGYLANEFYYRALETAGFKYSSIMNRNDPPVINLIKDELLTNSPFFVNNSVKEFPLSTVKINSIKGKEEIINLSPEFLILKTIKQYLHNMEYININFHSFSLLLTKLIREDHKNIFWHNLKYLICERTLNIILKKFDIYTLYGNTILKNELLNYLDFFSSDNSFSTKFIGEE